MTQQDIAPQAPEELGTARSQRGPAFGLATGAEAPREPSHVRKEVIGDATLYLGDCRDVLPTLGPVDVLISDPPYGVGFSGKLAVSRDGKNIKANGGYSGFDDTRENIKTVVVPAIKMALGLAMRGAVTPGTRSAFLYPEPTDIGCFYSAAGTGKSSWGFTCSQPILYYGKCPYLRYGAKPNSSGQSYPNDANATGHPCAKPIAQMVWLVNRVSLRGETVLDPFMGSGTTGAACARLNRRFVGIEIHEPYFDIAVRRIEEAQRQGDLLRDIAPKAKPQQQEIAL